MHLTNEPSHFILRHSIPKKQDNLASFPSFPWSQHISGVIIYQLCWHKSSFSSIVCWENQHTGAPWGNTGNICLLCDVNDGSVIAWSLKVMNNSHYFPIWWLTAVLKVNLTYEMVTELYICEIESGTHHLLFDVILVCWSVLSLSDIWENTMISVGGCRKSRKSFWSNQGFSIEVFLFLIAKLRDDHIKVYENQHKSASPTLGV